jgi:uncharacterized spore protein YtfJ
MSAHEMPGEGELKQYIPQASFLDRLADRLELAANARAVFGSPVERDGATVIPVAKARWGMGGGSGTRRDPKDGQPEVGTGGGGGATVTPLGFIELAKGEAKFRPIRDPRMAALSLLAGGFLGMSAVRAIARMGGTRPRFRLRMGRRRRISRLRHLFR